MRDYIDFYSEKKFCGRCGRYVRYLVSLTRSYCAVCGEPVNLFSKEDWRKFRRPIFFQKKKSSFLEPVKARPRVQG